MKRIRGYSKFPDVLMFLMFPDDTLNDVERDQDDAIMVGDFVAGKVIHEN